MSSPDTAGTQPFHCPVTQKDVQVSEVDDNRRVDVLALCPLAGRCRYESNTPGEVVGRAKIDPAVSQNPDRRNIVAASSANSIVSVCEARHATTSDLRELVDLFHTMMGDLRRDKNQSEKPIDSQTPLTDL